MKWKAGVIDVSQALLPGAINWRWIAPSHSFSRKSLQWCTLPDSPPDAPSLFPFPICSLPRVASNVEKKKKGVATGAASCGQADALRKRASINHYRQRCYYIRNIIYYYIIESAFIFTCSRRNTYSRSSQPASKAPPALSSLSVVL